MRQIVYSSGGYFISELIKKEENSKMQDLLIHLLNVTERGVKCAYIGRFYGEAASTPKRCLLPEIKGNERNCPLYNEDLPNKCAYNPESLDRKNEF